MPVKIAEPYTPQAATLQPPRVARKPPREMAALEKGWAYLLIGATVFSAVTTALTRPFWYDEIGTATVSGLHSFSQIWKALLNAADAQPPAFFWITTISRSVFSRPEFALRFPSIVGFTVLAACLYVFSRRVWGRVAGMVAVLVLMSSNGLYYASEGRPYGLLLGCLGVAALLWQNRKHGNHSLINLIGFLAALAALCAFHYYGVFVVAIFGAVEIVLGLASRKPDWAAISGIPLSTFPVVLAMPLIEATRHQIAAGFWARPSLKSIADGYVFALGNVPLDHWTLFRFHSGRPAGAGDILAPLLVVAGAAFFLRRAHRRHRFIADMIVKTPVEVLLATAILLLPLVAGLTAMASLGGYTPRYTIGAIMGSAVLTAWIAGSSGRLPGVLIVATLSILFACFQTSIDVRNLGLYLTGETPTTIARQRLAPLYSLTDNGTSIVIPDGHLLFESWYYARPQSRDKFIYLQDRQMAMRFSGTDSFDAVNEVLEPYLDLHLEHPSAYLAQHRTFLMAQQGNIQPWAWVNKYLDSEGAHYQLIEKGQDDLLISKVMLPDPAPGSTVSLSH